MEAGICPCCGKVPQGTRLDRIRHRMRNKIDSKISSDGESEESEEERKDSDGTVKGKNNRKNVKRKTKRKEDNIIKRFMDKLNNCPPNQNKVVLGEDIRSNIIAMCQMRFGKNSENSENDKNCGEYINKPF